ncbi:MAG: lipoyl synthase, partial [Geopsychrobacter sp.]|nr:lipoyl synthase [Geopsychrobacter sp.]
IPDFQGQALETLLRAKPHVVAHNIEVVERLSSTYRHQDFNFQRSLQVLEESGRDGEIVTKSSLMLGLGETDEEIESALQQLIAVGVRILVMGQYLSPTRQHQPVTEYVPPEKFDAWAELGRELGFDFVAAGPFVRTSYRAAEAYVQRKLRMQQGLAG